jgi:hypothetical protein
VYFLIIPLDSVVILSTSLGKALNEFVLVHIFVVVIPVKNLVPRSHEAAPRIEEKKSKGKFNQIIN